MTPGERVATGYLGKRAGVISETLMAVAGAGGSALVGAVATDAWQSARGGLVRLFARAGRREETAARWTESVRVQLPAERQSWVNTFIAGDHARQYNAPSVPSPCTSAPT